MMNSKLLAQSLMKISQKETSDESVDAFFSFLKEKNAFYLLPQIKKHLDRDIQKTLAQNKLVISSKHNLSDSEIEQICSLVGAEQNVEKEVLVDESLVGGFSAVYKGNIYDGSLRNQITQLKNQLTR